MVAGQTYDFTKISMKVYNSTSTVEVVKVAAISIINDCAPPKIKYSVKCGILLTQVGLAILSGVNPWVIAMIISSAHQIID